MRSGFCYAAILMVTLAASAQAYDWTTNPGDGSPENPYQISTPEQVIALGADTSISQGFYFFALTSDIAFDPNNNPDHVFEQAVIPLFRGCIDGRGFTIENLRISVSTYDNKPVGLIGKTMEGWGIRNLNIQNAHITTGDSFEMVGILCGLNTSYLHNCQVNGTIVCGTGSTQIGAICGSNGDGIGSYGMITHCQADVSISSSSSTGAIGECGGICGYNGGIIAHCSAEGTIEARSLSLIGGICGQQEYGEIVSCSASVNITAQRYLGFSGGLCGRNGNNVSDGSISHSYATGNMTSVGVSYASNYGYETINYVGGFCGYNSGAIASCYSTGDIACGSVEIGQGEETGGFCGRNSLGEIRDCFSKGNIICGPITGDVPHRERWIGGFCGTNNATIENCYSTGIVSTDAAVKAGFCYINYRTIEDSFWDTDASGILTASFSGTISGVTGKTTDQMQDPNTFLNAGWDFAVETLNGTEDIWTAEPEQYPSIFQEPYSGGDGSPANPFQLTSARDIIRLGNNEQDYYDYFILTNDIDLSGTVFTEAAIAPRTNSSGDDFRGAPFCGVLNGAGQTINHLTIQTGSVEKKHVGLFGGIGRWGRIQNLRLSHVSITGAELMYAGGICGENNGTIERCSVSGTLTGKSTMGGICAVNRGNISDVYTHGEYSGIMMVGGICGISGYYYTPSVGNLYRCYAAASLLTQTFPAGGLAGYLYPFANIYDSYWDIPVSGQTDGYNVDVFYGTIENVEGYTTSQMQQRASFSNWDFVGESANGTHEIWRMCEDGVDYPRLSWEFSRSGDFACADGVGLDDLAALAAHWLTNAQLEPAAFNHASDANGDERIDLADFDVLAENWPVP